MSIIDQIKDRFFTVHKPIKPGVYHYQAPPESDIPYRLHLRIEPAGNSLLILNASTVMHLNQSAAEFAYYFVTQKPVEEVYGLLARRYQINQEQAKQDFDDFTDRLHTLIEMPDLDPVTFLGFDRQDPYREEISTPYRLDCALTYQTLDASQISIAPTERVARELTEDEWKIILKKAWDAGIPHIIFTGGEPTIRPDLADLIAYAEELGQVTGLLTVGHRLAEPDFLESLLQKGLDHIMIVFQPEEDIAWEALRDILAEDIFVTVHLTITKNEPEKFIKLLDKFTEMGVLSISMRISNIDLKETLDQLQHEVAYRDLSMVWDLPVPYSVLNPVSIELGQEDEEVPVTGAGRAWLYIEPDGDVLLRKGKPTVLGNLLTDSWEPIWQKAKEKQDKFDG